MHCTRNWKRRLVLVGFGCGVTAAAMIIAPHTRGVIIGYVEWRKSLEEIRRLNPQTEFELICGLSEANAIERRHQNAFYGNGRRIVDALTKDNHGKYKPWLTPELYNRMVKSYEEDGFENWMWGANETSERSYFVWKYNRPTLLAQLAAYVAAGAAVSWLGMIFIPLLLVALLGFLLVGKSTNPGIERVTDRLNVVELHDGGNGTTGDDGLDHPAAEGPMASWPLILVIIAIVIETLVRKLTFVGTSIRCRAPPFARKVDVMQRLVMILGFVHLGIAPSSSAAQPIKPTPTINVVLGEYPAARGGAIEGHFFPGRFYVIPAATLDGSRFECLGMVRQRIGGGITALGPLLGSLNTVTGVDPYFGAELRFRSTYGRSALFARFASRQTRDHLLAHFAIIALEQNIGPGFVRLGYQPIRRYRTGLEHRAALRFGIPAPGFRIELEARRSLNDPWRTTANLEVVVPLPR